MNGVSTRYPSSIGWRLMFGPQGVGLSNWYPIPLLLYDLNAVLIYECIAVYPVLQEGSLDDCIDACFILDRP